MVNSVMLVGKLVEITDDFMKLSVARPYKNEEGIYENDIVPCKLFSPINKQLEYLKNDDIVGVRGRIATDEEKLIILSEKITFLSSSHKGE